MQTPFVGQVAEWVMWVSLGALFYTYLGFPALIWAMSRLFGRAHEEGGIEPEVSLLIPAHNESVVIRAKIENSLALDYPRDKLHVRVISDGSDDGTDTIVKAYLGRRVELQRIETRSGKANALNQAVLHAPGEVLVLCDANTMFAPDAVRHLVRHFADTRVGAVTGNVGLTSNEAGHSEGESLFYRIERFVQRSESRLWTVIGADGGMYALRRELYVPNKPDTLIDDFAIAMNVARTGARVVYEPGATATEDTAQTAAQEFRRRSRTVAGGFQALFEGRGRPKWNQPGLWFEYLSHKVLRWLSPLLLALMLAGSIAAVVGGWNGSGRWWACVAISALQVLFYALAAVGCVMGGRRLPPIMALPFYFCLANAAALTGFFKWLLRLQPVTWAHVDRSTPTG